MCHNPKKLFFVVVVDVVFVFVCVVVLIAFVVFVLVLVLVHPKNLPLKFGQNWDINR